MTMKYTSRIAIVLTLGLVGALAGCGGGGGGGATEQGSGGKATEGTVTADIQFWDPYPQRMEDSPWAQLVQSCAPEGSKITRTTMTQADLLNQLTAAVKEGNAPDIAVVDNPAVPEAVAAGLVVPAADAGIKTDGYDDNLIGPGVIDGVTYGVPFGSNALGLYYNKTILDKAGVDPTSIKDWASLNAAIEKVVKAGHKGITFSGVAGEEGVFQFEPWFWGAGADFSQIDSDAAISAGQLWSDWIGKGWAPKSATTDVQSAAWDTFLTGEYGFAENGSWFAQAGAENKSFEVGMVPIPGKDGGVAPVATGGEFAMAPKQTKDASNHYANAAAVIECLTTGENFVKANEALVYLAAKPDIRAEQIKQNELWAPWASIIENARGRTTELGADYLDVSAALSEATQGAMNAAGDADAVAQAFHDAAGN